MPVQLWEQGHARVLLNRAPQRSIAPATASICALAVDSSDPAQSMQRAARLLAPKLPRPRRPDETDLSSVAMPDGTALFFCESDRRHDWLDDFDPTGTPADEHPLLVEIDHVSITESIDDFDQSTLFFRSVLGLVPGESTEITAPFGTIRSWSASDPGDRVRITLSTTPLRRGDWAPGVSSPQLVAFATDDAIACAKVMRERGVQILEMPGNYYDDLDARLVAAARSHRESARELDPLRPRRAGRVPALLHRDAGLAAVLRGGSAHRRLPRIRRRPEHSAAHGRAPPSTPAHAGERSDRLLDRAPAPVLARPPDRAEPVTAGAGRCRRGRRLSLRGAADDEGHRGRTPLPPDLRPGTHACHQDAPRGDRHRGPRHRARPVHVRRQPARLPALPGGRRRARGSARHHAAAGCGLLPQDRSIRRAVPAGPATRLDHRPGVSVVDGDAESHRGHQGAPGRGPAQRRAAHRRAPLRPVEIQRGRPAHASAGVVPLRPRVRRPRRDPHHDGGPDPHRALRAAVSRRGRHRHPRHPLGPAGGHSVRLEIPRAELVAQVGAKEHTRLAIVAARRHLDAVAAEQR